MGSTPNESPVGEGLESLRENSVFEEGHGFSRATHHTAIYGFSRWGTVFLSSEFLKLQRAVISGLFLATSDHHPALDHNIRMFEHLNPRQWIGGQGYQVSEMTGA